MLNSLNFDINSSPPDQMYTVKAASPLTHYHYNFHITSLFPDFVHFIRC